MVGTRMPSPPPPPQLLLFLLSAPSSLLNSLIRLHSSSPLPHLSFLALIALLRSSYPPDHWTFPFAIRASASLRRPLEGAQVHAQVVKRGFSSDIHVVNNLIAMFSAFRDMGSARKLFHWSSEVLDVVSWNIVIGGYLKAGDLGTARELFDEMSLRTRNIVTWNLMVSGLARSGLVEAARDTFEEMPSRNLISWNAMVSGYCMNGEVDSARELFDKMPEKDVVSWTSMISGYARIGRHQEALDLFKEMHMVEGVVPNEVTMVSVLSACAHLSALDKGKLVHACIVKNQLCLDDEYNLGPALIDMYAKCGCVDLAAHVFCKLSRKNVSAWNAMINGLAVNGLSLESLDVFEKMRLSETKPNGVTFLGVLTACVHGCLLDEGWRLFKSMPEVYGVQPDIKHYGCIIDLFGRVGFLDEAEEVLRSMPMKPDITILGALLSACRIHKNVRIADRLRGQMDQLKPRDSGCHVLLSNIYAAVGKWSDASEMRRVMRGNMIRKETASSSVEMGGVIHEFVVGDYFYP